MEDLFKSNVGNPNNGVPLLEALKEKVQELLARRADILKLEAELETLEATVRNLSGTVIPQLMMHANLTRFTTMEGATLQVVNLVRASVAEHSADKAYAAMTAEDGEDCTKSLWGRKLVIDKPDDGVVSLLLDRGVPFNFDRRIHWKTLLSYVTNKLNRGEPIPDGITVFQSIETQVEGVAYKRKYKKS